MTDYHADAMPFGEFAGMAYFELAIDHADYCVWLLGQPWLDARIAGHIREAMAEVAAGDDDPDYLDRILS
jgi:hypothetical protein